MTDLASIAALVTEVQVLPYRWPLPPTADSARAERAGPCASKHALLTEELASIGIASRPLLCIGPLVPPGFRDHRDLVDGADLLEVHELLTVDVPGIGPCRVDITWDPPLIHAGLPGTLDWDGTCDMVPAVGAVHDWYAPNPEDLLEAKESLRRRIYDGDQRQRRDRSLAAMSRLFARMRDDNRSAAFVLHTDQNGAT